MWEGKSLFLSVSFPGAFLLPLLLSLSPALCALLPRQSLLGHWQPAQDLVWKWSPWPGRFQQHSLRGNEDAHVFLHINSMLVLLPA